MSNIRMLKNILKNIVENSNDKNIIKTVYNDAKNNPVGMHKMRQTFDPSYSNYSDTKLTNYNKNDVIDDSFEAYVDRSMGFRSPQDKSVIENFADDYYYGNIEEEVDRLSHSKLNNELKTIDDIMDNYPLYMRNIENLNDLPVYRGLNNFIHSWDALEDSDNMIEAANKYLYKKLYNDDPNELVSALMDGEEYLKANNLDIPEDYAYDLEKAIKMFGIK